MKSKSIFLTIALVSFAIGFSDAGESAFWYMGRPVGAIFLMLFMVFNLLEKESSLLDEQTKNDAEKNEKTPRERPGARSKSSKEEHRPSTLTRVSSH